MQRVTFWRSFSFFTTCMDYAALAIDLINKSWTKIAKFRSSQQSLSAYAVGLHQLGCTGALWKDTFVKGEAEPKYLK